MQKRNHISIPGLHYVRDSMVTVSWTLTGLTLLTACGGGGGTGVTVSGGQASNNYHVTVQDQVTGDAKLVLPDTVVLSKSYDDLYEEEALLDPRVTTVDFDATYDIEIVSSDTGTVQATVRPISNAAVPAKFKGQTSSAADKAAWKGFEIEEGGKTYGQYYLNTRTGQQEFVPQQDIINSLDDGETIVIIYRSSFNVDSFSVNGQDVISALQDSQVLATVRKYGYSIISGTEFTSPQRSFGVIGTNDEPTSRDARINIDESLPFEGFVLSHFYFADPDDNDALVAVVIVTDPQSGALTIERSGEALVTVTAGSRVARDDIQHLVYTPDAGFSSDSFDFRVSDGDANSGVHTLDLV